MNFYSGSRSRSARSARRARGAAVALTIVLAGALLSACTASEARVVDGRLVLRYQSSPGLVNHLELASALGYLDDSRFELDWVGTTTGGPESLRGLATRQTDIAIGPFQGSTEKVRSTGVGVTAVAATYGSSGPINQAVVVMDDSGIDTGHDLIGKTVAVNTLGANAEAVLDTYLDSEGLSEDEMDDVTLVPIPNVNAESALRNGQVDAALMGFAVKSHAMQEGGIAELAVDTDFVGEYNGGSYVLRDTFMEKYPEQTAEIVDALSRAITYEQEHSIDDVREVYGDWLTERDRLGDVEVLTTIWQGNGIATPGGVLRDEDFTLWLDWLEASGEIDVGAIDVDEIYTNEDNPAAATGTPAPPTEGETP